MSETGKTLTEGQILARARDKWLDSDEGLTCLREGARGQYLRNRLERAFIAGWHAAKLKGNPK